MEYILKEKQLQQQQEGNRETIPAESYSGFAASFIDWFGFWSQNEAV